MSQVLTGKNIPPLASGVNHYLGWLQHLLDLFICTCRYYWIHSLSECSHLL